MVLLGLGKVEKAKGRARVVEKWITTKKITETGGQKAEKTPSGPAMSADWSTTTQTLQDAGSVQHLGSKINISANSRTRPKPKIA